MQVGEFAVLVAARTRKDGALLEWGEPEQLPLPVEEQLWEVRKGEKIVVFITTDERVYQRPMATMLFREHFRHDTFKLNQNQEVELIIYNDSDLGFDAIIDRKYRGILYHNEVFQELGYGDVIRGYVKKVRDDGKVDLMTQLRGTRGTTDLGTTILEELQRRDGFLPLTDKSDPDDIYDTFGVSKKKFKMAIGRLYKHRNIALEENGIRFLKARDS